jgi:hypothetical protein
MQTPKQLDQGIGDTLVSEGENGALELDWDKKQLF